VVQAADYEIAFLKEAGVFVVNTPLCEMKITDGRAPIPAMVREGVTVCLGTDGALWNNRNDIFAEMKGMALLHALAEGPKALSAQDVLTMATINGARAFGLEAELGTIETGKRADFLLLETGRPHLQPLRPQGPFNNVASTVVYCATGADVSAVFDGGKQLVRNGQLISIDIGPLMARVRDSSEKIARNLQNFT
jgi:5-methylthioadenosine/S-adenosylhomocysteine deaminase